MNETSQADHVQFLITDCTDLTGRHTPSELSGAEDDFEPISYEPRISPATFCKAFPFHVMLDRDLRIIQVYR